MTFGTHPSIDSNSVISNSAIYFLDKNVRYSRTHCNSKNETHVNWSFSKNWKFFGWIHHYINCWSHLNGITQYYNQKADSGICSVHWPCMHYAVHCNAKSSQNAMLTWTTNEIRNSCRIGTFPLLTNFEKSLIWNDIIHPCCWWKCFWLGYDHMIDIILVSANISVLGDISVSAAKEIHYEYWLQYWPSSSLKSLNSH